MKLNHIKITGNHNLVIQGDNGDIKQFDIANLKEVNNFFKDYSSILPVIKNELESVQNLNKQVQEFLSLLDFKISIESRKSANLEIVDISIVDENGDLPMLDIKVLNNSDEPIFIKFVEISTLGYWEIVKDVKFRLIEVSHTYDFEIPLKGEQKKYQISQGVSPNDFDRFRIRMKGSYQGVLMGLSPYLINFKLVFNADNNFVMSPNILVHIPPFNVSWAGCYFPGWRKDRLKSNKKAALEMLSLVDDTLIVEDNIIQALKTWEALSDDEIENHR